MLAGRGARAGVLIALVVHLVPLACSEHSPHRESLEKHHDKERDAAPHHHGVHDHKNGQAAANTSLPGLTINTSVAAPINIVEDHVDGDGAMTDVPANSTSVKDPDAIEDFLQAFLGCFFVILATEVGDKTFFIAAILTMRQPRLAVWSGAMSALALMTVLSALVGHAAPLLLPPSLTHYAAVLLFFIFGVKMLKESRSASGGVSDELEEVEQELAEPVSTGLEDIPLTDEPDEASAATSDVQLQSSIKPDKPTAAAVGAAASQIMLQAFMLTFVAEWGDRSQIATIAMGADQDLVGVTLGGILGHACCTSLAVVGGKLLASRISEQTVLTLGGGLFLLFSVLEALHGPGD